jgi:DNA helicase II / ATP-dependent DNA helicase PcrA
VAWDDNLTGVALTIAETDDNPLRVMAGPGTGKSFAMKRRVARLLEEGIPPQRILAVTFTRMAAAMLRQDLDELAIDGASEVAVRTLHSFCFRILKLNNVFQYSGRAPRTLLTEKRSGVLSFEGRPMLSDLLATSEFRPPRRATERVEAFESAWARLQSETPGWPTDSVDKAFHQELMKWLNFHEAMLLGELIPEALRYLQQNPASDAHQLFDHVVVDEYQDLNRAEQQLLKELSDDGQLAIVGDPDQSIYQFKYAHPEGIVEFDADYPGIHDAVLAECRRCPKLVVELADHLIRHNHIDDTPRLIPYPSNPQGYVRIVQWKDISEESRELSRFIQWLIQECDYDPGDVLVLTPRKQFADALLSNLELENIEARSFFNDHVLDSPMAQRGITLLKLWADGNDRVSLRWWLGQGSNTHHRAEYKKLVAHCFETGDSPRELLDKVMRGETQVKGINKLASNYESLVRELSTINSLNNEDLVEKLFPASAVELAELHEAASVAMHNELPPEDVYRSVIMATSSLEVPEKAHYVRIMTPHKAKGLTSKAVIVSGCIQGLMPSIDEDLPLKARARQLEEQRRLFYVAVTRCTETLVFSSVLNLPPAIAYQLRAKVLDSGANSAGRNASQFLAELGPSAPQSVRGVDWVNSGYA